MGHCFLGDANIHTDTLVRSNGCVQQAATSKATSGLPTNWVRGTYWMPQCLCEKHGLVESSEISYMSSSPPSLSGGQHAISVRPDSVEFMYTQTKRDRRLASCRTGQESLVLNPHLTRRLGAWQVSSWQSPVLDFSGPVGLVRVYNIRKKVMPLLIS